MDQVTNEILKDGAMVKLLHSLFCTCFELQIIPELWRTAIIHPIPKEAGKVIDSLKYRGLALQSCIFKVFCGILNAKMVSFLYSKDILVEEQNGFRAGRSCQQHIFALTSLIKNCMKNSKDGLLATFIDFRKAN